MLYPWKLRRITATIEDVLDCIDGHWMNDDRIVHAGDVLSSTANLYTLGQWDETRLYCGAV